jgi:hypothetical protein
MENTLCKEQAVTSADHSDWQDWLRLSLTPHIGLQMQHRLVNKTRQRQGQILNQLKT